MYCISSPDEWRERLIAAPALAAGSRDPQPLSAREFPVLLFRIGALVADASATADMTDAHCSREQRERLARFHFAADRVRALGSIVLQRTLVHRVFPALELASAIGRTPFGKPFVRRGDEIGYCDRSALSAAGVSPPELPISSAHSAIAYNVMAHARLVPPGFAFNASHDGDLVALTAEDGCLVGIDIVDTRKEFPIEELREQFSAAEWARIQAAADPLVEFYWFWCLKEAYIKAIGSGMSIEPHRLELVHSATLPLTRDVAVESSASPALPPPHRLRPTSDSIAVLVDGRVQRGWHFSLFVADATHIGCVARGPHADAVDHHRRAARLGGGGGSEYGDGADEDDSFVIRDSDTGAVSAYCYAARHAAAMRRTECVLFSVTPHTDIAQVRVEKWTSEKSGAESAV